MKLPYPPFLRPLPFERLLTTRAAARLLGVSMSTVRNLVRAGELIASARSCGTGACRRHFRITEGSVLLRLLRQFPLSASPLGRVEKTPSSPTQRT